ncbi:unnamed protein product, partial [Rotaria sp. Silwood2]
VPNTTLSRSTTTPKLLKTTTPKLPKTTTIPIATLSPTTKSSITMLRCKKSGHIARNCRFSKNY